MIFDASSSTENTQFYREGIFEYFDTQSINLSRVTATVVLRLFMSLSTDCDAEYPELVTRTTCDRYNKLMMTVRWCVDHLEDNETNWLICWNLVRARSVIRIEWVRS